MQSPSQELFSTLLRVVEVAGWVLLALMHRATRRDVGDRVSAVGDEVSKVRKAVSSSLRPAALTCGACRHEQSKHTPRVERADRTARLGAEHEGPCLAPFCCCPEWKAPELDFEDDRTPTEPR